MHSSFQSKAARLIDDAIEQGYKFKRYSLSWEGSYIPQDSIWNYKDVRHFEHCHPKVFLSTIHTGTNTSFTRFFNFLGFSFPLVNVMLDESDDRVSFVFSFLNFYFLTIHTEELIDSSGVGKTLSTTEYVMGCRSRIILWMLSPLFKHLFRKSFDDFRAEDVPLQERRAWLRSKNYSFTRDRSPYTFFDTMDLTQRNVNLGDDMQTPKPLSIALSDLEENNLTKCGESDAFGFQILKRDTKLQIFSRLCPHEGGCLDVDGEFHGSMKLCDFKGRVQCSFHKRTFGPLAILSTEPAPPLITPYFRFSTDGEYLHISYNDLTTELRNGDWTEPNATPLQ